MMPPARPSASGSRPQYSTASSAASGRLSSSSSHPPARSSSSSDASAESTLHCTSDAPSSSERMRVVMTTAERQAPCTKLSGVACDASHTSSSTSSTVAAPAASLSASRATRSSA